MLLNPAAAPCVMDSATRCKIDADADGVLDVRRNELNATG